MKHTLKPIIRTNIIEQQGEIIFGFIKGCKTLNMSDIMPGSTLTYQVPTYCGAVRLSLN